MTIREIQTELLHTLAPVAADGEARAIQRAIIEDTTGLSRLKIVTNPDYELTPESVDRIRRIAARVAAGEPVQYAIGTALFRGRAFGVRPGVLIPRPETAQLVDMIVDARAGQKDVRMLDIGTGSGCIACSLALDLPFAIVTATDISPDALAQARTNAQALNAQVAFQRTDILAPSPLAGGYDVIVSNPPYVMQKEAAEMDPRVLNYEPRQAIFVPDADPLLFYRAIARKAQTALNPGGALYFEINPLCASELQQMLRGMGYGQVDIIRDYRGQIRFATAQI